MLSLRTKWQKSGGDKIYTDTWKWMMYAFFCRMSETPIPVSEGEFLVNLIKIKNN